MYDRKKLDELKDSLEKWEKTSLQKALASMPERKIAIYYNLIRTDQPTLHSARYRGYWITPPILDCRANTLTRAESTRRFIAANCGR